MAARTVVLDDCMQKLLPKFLDQLSDEMGNAGCNDFWIEKMTPEWRAFLLAAYDGDAHDHIMSVPDGARFCALDFLLVNEVKRRLEGGNDARGS